MRMYINVFSSTNSHSTHVESIRILKIKLITNACCCWPFPGEAAHTDFKFFLLIAHTTLFFTRSPHTYTKEAYKYKIIIEVQKNPHHIDKNSYSTMNEDVVVLFFLCVVWWCCGCVMVWDATRQEMVNDAKNWQSTLALFRRRLWKYRRNWKSCLWQSIEA